MKKMLLMMGVIGLGSSANAGEIIGQLTLLCKGSAPIYTVGVYRDLQDPSGTNVFVTTPLGFLGRGTQTVAPSQVIVDVPVLSGNAGKQTLDVDLSKNHCLPTGILKDSHGNVAQLSCINNGPEC